jgi:transposase
MTRSKTQLARDRVRLHSQLEGLLEEMRIKLSSVVSDLLGVSGLRILNALPDGQTDPGQLAALGHQQLRCTQEQLVDALTGQPQTIHLALLKLYLERLRLIDAQTEEINHMIAQGMKAHEDAVGRLTEVSDFGVDAAQQVIAEVGAAASTFDSAAQFTSWART